VYPPGFSSYPIGAAMNKNLILNLGNCNHRRYIPKLLDLVATGLVDPTAFITQKQPPESAIAAYETFDRRDDGWLETVLDVGYTHQSRRPATQQGDTDRPGTYRHDAAGG
jgi:threonine dehydrogenase-like Zn-dependent dehydrogenase